MMSRREVLKSAVTAGVVAATSQLTVPFVHAAGRETRPNLLFLSTDQQHWRMLSCAGNTWLKTPHMDSLAATGVRFPTAYCTNPVCVPSRASYFTGVYPSRFNMRANESKDSKAAPELLATGAGNLLTAAGYDVAFAGKQHFPRCMTAEQLGFRNVLTKNDRDECADLSAQFIRQKHEKPRFLVCSLINPHDICMQGIRAHPESEFEKLLMKVCTVELETLDKVLASRPAVDEETFLRDHCPPLPANHLPLPDEPSAIADYMNERPFMTWIRQNWTDRDWRLYRWLYHRLTEMVDVQIGRVLAALRETGQLENTVVILTSDHGDNDSARKADHKSLPYDESARVPFIISHPGQTRAGITDDHLISNGLDLVPTLCDYAGIAKPAHMPGQSIRPLAEGRAVAHWRQTLVVESEIARSIRDDRYKYIVFRNGTNRTQLFDLQSDPIENVNLISSPSHTPIRQRLHAALVAAVQETGDPFGQQWLGS